jgi:hypothetical protein
VVLVLAGLLVAVGPVSAFFPCKAPPKKPKCDTDKCPPKTPPKKPPHDCPPDRPPGDDIPPPDPPGDSIPEIDPSSMAGALGVVMTGALMLTDRRRRRK